MTSCCGVTVVTLIRAVKEGNETRGVRTRVGKHGPSGLKQQITAAGNLGFPFALTINETTTGKNRIPGIGTQVCEPPN